MSLLMIAEVLAGETLMTPGGAVDRMTATSHDPNLWSTLFVFETTLGSGSSRDEVSSEVIETTGQGVLVGL